jgi:hypothetical protein
MLTVLYHYTSKEGYAGILQTKRLLPSLRAHNPKDARFGDGQYLSDIVPGTKRPGQLSYLFFGIPWGWRRFTHHINLDVNGLAANYCRPHVYVIRNSVALDISNRILGHGQVATKR